MTDRSVMNSTFLNKSAHWRETVIPFVIENYQSLPDKQKENISNMHHVFCGLHVLHNLRIYSEKAILEWEKIVEEEVNSHGGFKITNSRTYDILFEISKLLSYSHGDHKSGNADQWQAYLKKNNTKNCIISFLHRRFNVKLLLGGVFYFHRENIIEFLKSMESEIFLMSSVKQDVNEIVFSARTRALGVMEKLVTGPLFKSVSQSEHIFDLNEMWEELLTFLERNAKNSSFLMAESTVFPYSLLTKDEMYKKLFQDTENPDVDLHMCVNDHSPTKRPAARWEVS